jgi:ABC-type transport system involved in multi-copper enzyme maturation permease subunit
MISVIRAFRSEMLKFRRWSVLVGAGVMVVVSTFIAYLTFHQIASGASGSEMTDLIAAFHTSQGLVAIIGQARSLIVAIALILVSANLAAEWTQGTLRNLLVREPHRLRWLVGKMLAVVLFVLLSMLLTLVISSTVILLLARGQGIQTTAWTSAEGLRIFLEFFGNEVLCLIGFSALGMLIAVLTRSVVAAVGIALAYILVLEGIIGVVAPQPLREDSMLTGSLEPTNEPYAIAKIAGIKMVESYRRQYGADFISVMPTNLYGPGDNYHPEHGHVVAALIRRFHEAKLSGISNVVVWGTGTPRREFLYVDDMADACVHLMQTYSSQELVNIGTGKDITIAEFARVVANTVGYTGAISFDPSRPDGTPRKLLDVSRLAQLGWRARTSLEDGIGLAYRAYLSESKQAAE